MDNPEVNITVQDNHTNGPNDKFIGTLNFQFRLKDIDVTIVLKFDEQGLDGSIEIKGNTSMDAKTTKLAPARKKSAGTKFCWYNGTLNYQFRLKNIDGTIVLKADEQEGLKASIEIKGYTLLSKSIKLAPAMKKSAGTKKAAKKTSIPKKKLPRRRNRQ